MALKQDTIVEVLFRNRLKLIAFIRTIVRDFHAAEDIYQSVSLLAVRSAEKFNDMEHLLRWLWTVCRTESIRNQKKNSKYPMLFDGNTLETIQHELQQPDTFDSQDVFSILEKCFSKLSDYAKKLLFLRYNQGIKGAKLADCLNRNIQSVYVALSRTHETLRNCINNQMKAQ